MSAATLLGPNLVVVTHCYQLLYEIGYYLFKISDAVYDEFNILNAQLAPQALRVSIS